MTDLLPLTLIHGPTIRQGTDHASLVRSQLMRQRYREKRLRILHKNYLNNNKIQRDDDNQTKTQDQALLAANLAGTNLRQIAPSQIDPFFPDNRKTTTHFDFLLHECLHVVFPTARPGEFAERSIQAYLHPDRSPMVIQSVFYSVLLHLHVLPIVRGASSTAAAETSASYTIERLRIQGSVMNQIRQSLSTVNSNNIHEDKVEDLVMSILYLATNEHLEQIRPPEKGPFSPPFRTLQSMEYYGSCEVHPLHWDTVQHIIRQRGGLSSLKIYGLAWLISISALIAAVNVDCKPVFPLINPDGKPFVYRAPLQALSIRQSPRHVTFKDHGFRQLALLNPPVKGIVIRVFLDLTEMTQALDYLAGQRCSAPLLSEIGDTRAIVLHRLCNLPEETDRPSSILHRRKCTTEERDRAITMYIICRKTALLYSANVVLPLPQTSMIRWKMTLEIQTYMLQLTGERRPSELEILLWCSVIAGICADVTPSLRSWFIREARNFCNYLKVTTWDELLEIMQSFAWLDCASDEAGKALWSEMELCN